jgi:hypothetical protein
MGYRGAVITIAVVAIAVVVLGVGFAAIVRRDSLPRLKRAIMRFVRSVAGSSGCARLADELLGGATIAGHLVMAGY